MNSEYRLRQRLLSKATHSSRYIRLNSLNDSNHNNKRNANKYYQIWRWEANFMSGNLIRFQ